jgi:acyl-CoA thioester hydrolase
MARIKIDLPSSFAFVCNLEVRITDLNFGSHVGNDTVLSYLHQGRAAYLRSLGYSELDLEGTGLIMADAALVFKQEIFYPDELQISIQPEECSRVGFDLIYKIEKKSGELPVLLVLAKTAMICFDYPSKKISALPLAAKLKLFPPPPGIPD